MKDWIFKDIKSAIKDKSSLKEFIKIDDINEIYEFCQKEKDLSQVNYTEDEFTDAVDNIIENLSEDMFENSEW